MAKYKGEKQESKEEMGKLVERGREGKAIISAKGETAEQFCQVELKQMKHMLAS